MLAPCGVNDFVCGRATEWVSNGTDLCLAAGFRVKPSDIVHVASEETFCYGDKASLGSVADSWKTSQFESTKKGENSMIFDDFQQWTRNMPFNERVSWAIGGMVLTAGLVFIRSKCNTFWFLLIKRPYIFCVLLSNSIIGSLETQLVRMSVIGSYAVNLIQSCVASTP